MRRSGRGRLLLGGVSLTLVVIGLYVAQNPKLDPVFIEACKTNLGSESACRCIGRRLIATPEGTEFYKIVSEKRAFLLYAHMPKYQAASMQAMQPCM